MIVLLQVMACSTQLTEPTVEDSWPEDCAQAGDIFEISAELDKANCDWWTSCPHKVDPPFPDYYSCLQEASSLSPGLTNDLCFDWCLARERIRVRRSDAGSCELEYTDWPKMLGSGGEEAVWTICEEGGGW